MDDVIERDGARFPAPAFLNQKKGERNLPGRESSRGGKSGETIDEGTLSTLHKDERMGKKSEGGMGRRGSREGGAPKLALSHCGNKQGDHVQRLPDKGKGRWRTVSPSDYHRKPSCPRTGKEKSTGQRDSVRKKCRKKRGRGMLFLSEDLEGENRYLSWKKKDQNDL